MGVSVVVVCWVVVVGAAVVVVGSAVVVVGAAVVVVGSVVEAATLWVIMQIPGKSVRFLF